MALILTLGGKTRVISILYATNINGPRMDPFDTLRLPSFYHCLLPMGAVSEHILHFAPYI